MSPTPPQTSPHRPRTILITGSSSGLGHALLTHYTQQPHTTIHALDRTPFPQASPPHSHATSTIHFHTVDITSSAAVALVASKCVSAHNDDNSNSNNGVKIDLLIHSAGIRGLVPDVVERNHGGDVAGAEGLEVMDRDTMMRTLEVNTWGAFNVIKTFLPLLRRRRKKGSAVDQGKGQQDDKVDEDNEEEEEGAKVIVMSSRMGSVSANVAGGGYAYRASKAALNALVKSFSVDVGDVTFLLLHPGRVETGLVGWKEEGAMSVGESLETCLRVVERCGEGDSGTFVDRFGEVIAW